MLGFSCVAPIRTVHELLDEYDVLDLLRDPLITTATQEIIAEKKGRREIQREIRAKERAIESLSAKYRREPKLTQEMVRQALYSIGDNHAFLRTNRDPCDRMIGYLQKYFHPTQVRDKKSADSLAIRSGRGGARLSHDHARQYVYVMQSLALWREILHGAPGIEIVFSVGLFTDLPLFQSDMFHLWSLAEQDLLSETISYRLRDTGQGLNRVQSAPKTSRMMHAILNRAQKSLGGWVGSSVIHMGDHNVPNALMFIGTLPMLNLHLPNADIIQRQKKQTSTHRSTGSSCPSAIRFPSYRRYTSRPRCAHILTPSTARSTRSTSRSLATFSDMRSMGAARITFMMRGAASTDVSPARGTGARRLRRSVISTCSYSQVRCLKRLGLCHQIRPHRFYAQASTGSTASGRRTEFIKSGW